MSETALPAVCSVALPLPAPGPYTYRIPRGIADRVARGSRVVVPVRSREMVGVVLDCADGWEGSPDDLKEVLLVPDPGPLLPPTLLELARWVSRFYAAPLGLTLKAMLPGALWGASTLAAVLRDAGAAPGGFGREVVEALARKGGRATASHLRRSLHRPVWDVLQRLERVGAVTLETLPPRLGPAPGTETVVRLTAALPSLMERDHRFGRARRQREAYDAIDAVGGEIALAALTKAMGFSRSVIDGLVARGVAAVERRRQLRDPFTGVSAPPPAAPTADQRRAIADIHALAPGGAATLFGVTGSGKTLVYLEAIRDEVRRGGSAIVLVPEIALTPQTIARVRGVFGDAVAVLHSGLSDGERADAWRALAGGAKRVAVGARSAIFAPLRRLSAIVIDEEHDGSYKNGELPRYHAREVALRRAQLDGARTILGSATPSLEVWAARDRIPVITLPARVTGRPLPDVDLVDMRSAAQVAESRPVPWSEALDQAIERALARREQVMLLLNRRGFAHFLQCGHCGEVVQCPSCSIALTVHRVPPRLRCHYCGFERAIPDSCPQCGGATQRTRGVGTQTLERWLAQRFPGARMARMDADTTTTKWSHGRILDEFARRELDLLFGTQMIAKGLDFPGVTLVGVVNADTGLHLPDFRAAERTFQLIAQVAGRAGRGEAGGRVLVQTRAPGHYALTCAARHDYVGFAERELDERRSPAYPPHVALANVVVSGGAEAAVAGAADDVAEWVRGLIDARGLEADVLGPAPAPLARIQGRWRWHLIVRAPAPRVLGSVVRYAAERAPHVGGGAIRVVFDRDPVSLL